VGFAVVGGVWEGLKAALSVSNARLPHVWSVLAYLGAATAAGEPEWQLLLRNLATTLQESAVGLAFALVIGGALGVATAKWRIFGRSVTPLLVLTQTLPIVAVAPALVIWLGQDWISKAAIGALIAFFPIAVSVQRGIRDVPDDQILLMRSFGASRLSLLRTIELPSALTQANAAVPTAAALAVVGAVIAELSAGTGDGIAVVLLQAAQFYNFVPAALWCAAIATALCGLVVVYGARFSVSRLARLALRTSYLPDRSL